MTDSRPLRILWLSHFVPWPPAGGALQRSYHLLREVASRHRVHLVSLSQIPRLRTGDELEEAKRALSPYLAGLDVFTLPFQGHTLDKVRTALRARLRGEAYDVAWLRHQPLHDHLRTLATTTRFDLIHADTAGLWPYTSYFRGVPVIVNHHNVESQMMERRSVQARNPLIRYVLRGEAKRLRELEVTTGTGAARHLVVSALDRDRLLEIVPDAAVDVVENGVDLEYFRPSDPTATTPNTLVFVGRLNAYTNEDAALFLLREIMPLLPDHTLTLVGANPTPTLMGAAARMGAQVAGFLPDVRPVVGAAEIYICPMRDGGGTRLKVLDALAMAKPLIATGVAVEGLGLIPGQHFILAEAPEEFGDGVRRLSASVVLRTDLGTAGRKHVEDHFGWSAIGAKMLEACNITAETSMGQTRPSQSTGREFT